MLSVKILFDWGSNHPHPIFGQCSKGNRLFIVGFPDLLHIVKAYFILSPCLLFEFAIKTKQGQGNQCSKSEYTDIVLTYSSDISVWVTFKFFVTFQFSWHFSLGDTLAWVTFPLSSFYCLLYTIDRLLLRNWNVLGQFWKSWDALGCFGTIWNVYNIFG